MNSRDEKILEIASGEGTPEEKADRILKFAPFFKRGRLIALIHKYNFNKEDHRASFIRRLWKKRKELP